MSLEKFHAEFEALGVPVIQARLDRNEIGGSLALFARAWLAEKARIVQSAAAEREENREIESLSVARQLLTSAQKSADEASLSRIAAQQSAAIAKRSEARTIIAIIVAVLTILAMIGIAINETEHAYNHSLDTDH